jgi:hypothetical protein
MNRVLTILIGLLLVASFAGAADWGQQVSSMTQGQGQVERSFDGPEGMTGIIIGPAPGAVDNGKVLAWGTPSGLLIIGNVYDRNGRNLSDVVRQDKPEWFQPQPVVAKTAAAGDGGPLWAEAETFLASGRAVSEGQGERVYVFTAYSCGYCKKFYREIHADPTFLKRFEIVWVPVTRDGKDFSTGAILNGEKRGFMEKGGHVTKAQEELVLDNTYFLQDNGGRLATPAFLIKQNGVGKIHYGLNVQTLQSVIGG